MAKSIDDLFEASARRVLEGLRERAQDEERRRSNRLYAKVLERRATDQNDVVSGREPRSRSEDLRHEVQEDRGAGADGRLRLARTPPLVPVRDHLVGRFPSLEEQIDELLGQLAAHRNVRLPPLLLLGGGRHRTFDLARSLVIELGLPWRAVDAAELGADLSLRGMRTDGGRSVRVHVELIQEHGIANAALIIAGVGELERSDAYRGVFDKLLDEFDRAGRAVVAAATDGRSTDASHIVWICKTDTLECIPTRFLKRTVLFRCDDPA